MPEDRVTKLENEVERLLRMVDSMQNKNMITPDFRKVLELNALTTSAKSAGSENQIVNESGSSTYSVLSNPSGFLEITIGGTTYYIPYFPA